MASHYYNENIIQRSYVHQPILGKGSINPKPDFPIYRVPMISLTGYLYPPSNIKVPTAYFKKTNKQTKNIKSFYTQTHTWVHFIFKLFVEIL